MIVAATTYVREHPDTTPQLLRRALLEEGKAEEKRGRMEVAIGLYDKLQEDVTTSEGAEAAYREIAIRFEEQNYDLAEELVYEFADKNSPQQMWLARSFLLLGDIYVARDNLFQARATYQSIVDGYTSHDDGIVAAAKERVEALLETAEEPTTK
jgi:tetratricopeptide (TPR) repeat protein